MIDRLQRQRFEYKYLITEEIALAVRDFVSGYLELDAFGRGRPELSYPVHSIYLDSPDLSLYQHTINGDKNRFKLRLRCYEEDEDRPVFFEIKRRVDNTIHKKRVAVRRQAVEDLLAGYAPPPGSLVHETPAALEALDTFTELVHRLGAVPQSHVCYQREAWVETAGNSVRVTIDRNVLTEPRDTVWFDTSMTDAVAVFGDAVILELKFTARCPTWFNHLVQAFGLRQRSAARYVDGIERLTESGLLYALS